jgi:homospermidine synthase
MKTPTTSFTVFMGAAFFDVNFSRAAHTAQVTSAKVSQSRGTASNNAKSFRAIVGPWNDRPFKCAETQEADLVFGDQDRPLSGGIYYTFC